MTQLSDSELNALRNLAVKHNGEPVPFINIAAARALTEIGFAIRNRGGWEIAPRGEGFLAGLDETGA